MAKVGPLVFSVLAVVLALAAGPALAMMGGWDDHGGYGGGSSTGHGPGDQGGSGPGAQEGYGPGGSTGYGPGASCPGPGWGLYYDEAAEAHAYAFEGADVDGDGALTPDEFQTYVALVQQTRAALVFERLDSDDDGKVSAEEFQQGARGARRRRAHW